MELEGAGKIRSLPCCHAYNLITISQKRGIELQSSTNEKTQCGKLLYAPFGGPLMGW
jgi:hypothetical protein